MAQPVQSLAAGDYAVSTTAYVKQLGHSFHVAKIARLRAARAKKSGKDSFFCGSLLFCSTDSGAISIGRHCRYRLYGNDDCEKQVTQARLDPMPGDELGSNKW